MVNSARKKLFTPKPFYSLPIANIAPICLQTNVKVTLGKSFPLLWNTMQNSPRETPQAHGSDLAPVKYPTGVTDSSRK
jgi:hypothetical protein